MSKVLSFSPADNLNGKSHRKENAFHGSYKIFDIDKRSEVVDLHIYWPGSVCYACLWVGGVQRATGSAKAGGYGYDKEEQAVKLAFQSAGFEIEERYNWHSPKDILEAVAAYMGITNFHIFRAHP